MITSTNSELLNPPRHEAALLDESIWVPVADGLRRRGWTVRVARDEGMLGEPDRKQLALAEENIWLLVTFDDDFLSLVEAEGSAHAGIIFVRQAGRNIGDVVKAVDAHLAERPPDDHGISYVISVVSFIVALIVGGLAIYSSARIVTGTDNYGHAIITAILGAIAWALTAWIPLLGPLIALLAWIAVLNWRYKGGWINAIIMGVIAWLSATVILFILNRILRLSIGAFGVPGV